MDNVIRSFFENNIDIKNGSVITIGKFDGVHIGHQKLICKCVDIAEKRKLTSIAIVFLKKENSIYPEKKNIEYIKSMGINYIIIVDFSKEFYKMDKEEFFNKLIEYYKMKHIVAGGDFRFGYNREGTNTILKEYCKRATVGFSILSFMKFRGKKISTSFIREELLKGDMKIVSKMLGRDYVIDGVVEHGKAIGRTIGFATANLYVLDSIVIPKEGVYFALVKIEGRVEVYEAMGFVGTSSINEGLRLEVHLLDFDEMIYGKVISVYLLYFSRENVKIDSTEELKTLLKNDEQKTKRYFKRRR